MIVIPKDNGGLILIQQVEHARLAGRIALAWVKPDAFEQALWDRLVDATVHHDNGWMEHDQQPTLDAQGKPNNFKFMPMELHRQIWRKSIDMAITHDWLAALLVMIYAKRLYKDYGQHGEHDQEFINELSETAARLIAHAQDLGGDEAKLVEPQMLSMLLSMFIFWDGLSLTLLKALPWKADWQYEAGRSMLHVKENGAGDFDICPWPLSSPELSIPVNAVQLKKSIWPDSEEFKWDFDHAKPIVINVHLRSC